MRKVKCDAGIMETYRLVIGDSLNRLNSIELYLDRLTDEQYRKPLDVLSGGSIGAHTRHILEFYQCLWEQVGSGKVDYGLRPRDIRLQEEVSIARSKLHKLQRKLARWLPQENKELLVVHQTAEGVVTAVATSLERELAYNIEHLIHHLALIKIGLNELAPEWVVPDNFGVAASTEKFRRTHLLSKTS